MTDLFPGAKLMVIPQGSSRLAPSPLNAFSVIHITGNSGLPSAEQECQYRINAGASAVQVGATFFVNRNGSIVQAYADPLRTMPWTNGYLNNPNLANPRIAACVTAKVNPNLRSLITIENVGYEPGNPITAAQEDACARLVAYYHARIGLPVNRQTVIGHYELDSVNRPNCPGVNKALIDRIAGGAPDSMTIVTRTPFPTGPRKWTVTTAKTLTGYKPDGTTKSIAFSAGSWATASGTALIVQNPSKAPNGTFLEVDSGGFAGWYLIPSQVSLDPAPADPMAELEAENEALKQSNQALTAANAELAASLTTPNGTIVNGQVTLT